MSNPFQWFRKRQKTLMVVFGVLLIFVFTISMGTGVDPLIELLSGNWSSSGGRYPVVVSWRGGTLRENDLQELRQKRRLAVGYVYNVALAGQAKGAQPAESMLDDDASDAGILRLELLAAKAQEMGLSVSDQDIKDYLINLSGGKLRQKDLAEILRNFVGNQMISDAQMFELLRRELMAHRAHELLTVSGNTVSPVQIWDQFNRLERSVTVELMPVEVDRFLDKVAEPAETELRAFFNEHKDDYAFPDDPTPGFKQRERRAFEFVKFDFDAFVEVEAAKVSVDEARKYYEENKEDFIQTKLPESDLELPAKETEPQADDMTEGDASTDREESAKESDAENAVEESSGGDLESEQIDSTGSAAERAPEDAAATDGPNQDVPDGATPSEPSQPEPTPSPLPQDAPSVSNEGESDSADAGASISAERYKPFEEVEEEIRKRLAQPIARQRMEDTINRVRQRVMEGLQWRRANPNRGQDTPEIEIDDLSTAPPLQIESIPLSDELEVRQYELGRTFDTFVRDGNLSWVSFPQIAFQRGLEIYQPTLFPTQTYLPLRFVFWMTENEPPHEPSFEEVRNDAVTAWKRREAYSLALAEAESLAAKAREAGKSLEESIVAEGRTFLGPVDIRWLTMGSVPVSSDAMPRPVEIPGVEGTTEEMLRKIFRMEIGDVGVVTNAARSIVYVVHVTGEGPAVDIRRNIFLRDPQAINEMNRLLQREFVGSNQSLLGEVFHQAEVHWHRDPDNGRQNF